MNIYGCLPSAFFSSPNPVTYWAHAASLAGYPSAESVIIPTSVGLTGKKSQMPLELTDVLLKKRGVTIIRDASTNDNVSSFRVGTRCLSPNGDSVPSASKSSPPHLMPRHSQNQGLHSHLQNASQIYRKDYTSSPPLPFNGLTSLQALCDSDVSAFTSRRNISNSGKYGSTEGLSDSSLKFGINRILSDDFGKAKKDKENGCKRRVSFPEARPAFPLCPCTSPGCTAYSHSHAVCSYNRSLYSRAHHHHHHHHLPSLSAVHALQPPNYPLSTSVDALPGPYSILSTEAGNSNQPKRKRSWSRAVFSNLQRKGLEKRFEVQKYVTKPDRRQLAAMLGLTDAQVKVWFQNRRMKWRHAQQQGDKDAQTQEQEPEVNEKKDQKISDLTQQKSNQRDGTLQSSDDSFSDQGRSSTYITDNDKATLDSNKNESLPENSVDSQTAETVHKNLSDEDSEVAIIGSSGNGSQEDIHGEENSNGVVCVRFGTRTDYIPGFQYPEEHGTVLPFTLMETGRGDGKDGISHVGPEFHARSSQRPVDGSIRADMTSSDEDSDDETDSIMRDINVED